MVLECLGCNVYSEACKSEVAVWNLVMIIVIVAIIGRWYLANKKKREL